MNQTLLPLLVALALPACGAKETDAAVTPTLVRLSAIPDFNKGTLEATCKSLCDYLSKEIGVEVRYDAANDYTASVNGLIAGKLDLVWYGGVTSVEAEQQAGAGNVAFVATRDIDLKFKSYFIANKAVVDAGKVKPAQDLKALKPAFEELTFTFGDKKSTSGHVMPRHFLAQAGIDAEQDFKGPAAFRASGGHAATMASVTSGEVDMGALNYSYYDKASAEERQRAPIVYTTPDYVDYCFVAHNRLGKELVQKIRAALLKLDPADPAHAAILKNWGAGKFVPAESSQWDGIRAVLKSLPRDFLK